MPVFISSTPSDYRATRNALAMMKRAPPPEDKPPAGPYGRLMKRHRAEQAPARGTGFGEPRRLRSAAKHRFRIDQPPVQGQVCASGWRSLGPGAVSSGR
jgi:hypothetical protein